MVVELTNAMMGFVMVGMIGFFGAFMIEFLEKELNKMDARDLESLTKIQRMDVKQ